MGEEAIWLFATTIAFEAKIAFASQLQLQLGSKRD
jgi:hypothetical protein